MIYGLFIRIFSNDLFCLLALKNILRWISAKFSLSFRAEKYFKGKVITLSRISWSKEQEKS